MKVKTQDDNVLRSPGLLPWEGEYGGGLRLTVKRSPALTIRTVRDFLRTIRMFLNCKEKLSSIDSEWREPAVHPLLRPRPEVLTITTPWESEHRENKDAARGQAPKMLPAGT